MFSKGDDKNKDICAIEIRSDESDDDIPTTNKYENGKSKDQITQQKKYNLAAQWCLLTVFLLGISLSVASLTAPSLRSAKPVLGLAIWQWFLLITALLAGPVLSQALKKFILFYTDHYSNEVYYLVMLLANAWAVLYFSLILLVWTWVVNQPSYLNAPRGLHDQEKNNILIKFTKVKHLVTLTLITILLGSFLWLLKDLCIMYGKKRFHTMRFFDRIKESLIDEYRIKILSGQPPVGAPPSKDLFYFEKNIFGTMQNKKIDLIKLCKVTTKTVSSWMMKKLVDRIIDGRPLRFIDHRNNEVDFDSEMCAIEVSNIIFSRLACQGDQDHPSFTKIRKDQLSETLSKYFNTDEASEVMQWLLQGADADKIGKDLVKMRMIRAWRERNALIRAMQSNKSIFKQLNLSVNVILVIVIFVVWIVMLKVEFRRALFFIGSAIVSSAFIFGDFCRKLVDSLVLIFVTHPYDVGDCCLIDKTPVTIDEINLLTTVAYTLDHEKRFYPHPVLAGLTISNFTRSRPYMGDSVEFYLDFHTPLEKIEALKCEIRRYIRKNPQDWNPSHLLIVELEMKDDGKTYLKTTLQFQHTINYHDYRERQKRRNLLIFKLKSILEEQKLLEQNTNDNKDKK